MRKNLKIILIAFVTLLIVASPVVAAENNVEIPSLTKNIFDFDIWSWLFPPTVKVSDVHIVKENYKHTQSDGKVDKSTNYYLEFNLVENSVEELDVKVFSYDKNGKEVDLTIKTIEGYPNSYSVKLGSNLKIDHADLLIYNGESLVLNETTDVFEKISNEKVDQPVVEKPKDTSSSSSTKYWASSKSNKFHYPSCEWAQKISSKNKIVFSSRSEAINSGYVPCQVCGP